ncbi:acyltransferase [Endozoicomonas numazuensis]|uniref:Acetyltransferase n=1 Tax=Endozoicomonas numazuensis TaxID=1137799 RepID=A0A081NKA1_9GAMM|nr:acyltransferase [Endozoicomonas numazuensis]KEQ18874.1 acetyltransferase [Endozoicomonas numazuensis]
MINSLKNWLKSGNSPIARFIFSTLKAIRYFEFPLIRPLHSLLYHLHKMITGFFASIGRALYWTPLFKSRLKNNPKRLYVYSGMPLLLGPLSITFGDNCRISGHSTISGRASSVEAPSLKIGDNVGISWQNEIFVGRKIEIGNNVRLAVKVRLVGYPGHPVDPIDRAKGLPDTDDQVGDIIIEDNVWLAAGVTVMGGVRIGAGTIVASGSVVTKDLPAGVLAGGIPAKVIKSLDHQKESLEA